MVEKGSFNILREKYYEKTLFGYLKDIYIYFFFLSVFELKITYIFLGLTIYKAMAFLWSHVTLSLLILSIRN